jgi:hypothetical protein
MQAILRKVASAHVVPIGLNNGRFGLIQKQTAKK